MRVFLRSSVVFLGALCVVSSARAETTTSKTAAEAAPPVPAGLKLQVIAPPTGPWTMVLSNDGAAPLRVSADSRLLSLEVVSAPDAPVLADGARKARRDPPVKAYPRGKLPACRMPAEMRPHEPAPERALILKPGERYVERFDPVALCGASKLSGELVGGAVVYASYGYPLATPAARRKKGAPPPPPYVAEPLRAADEPVPVRWVEAPGIMLSRPPAVMTAAEPAPATSAAGPEPRPDAPPVDERAAKLTLRAQPFDDAEDAGAVTISVRLTNVGKRKATVHLREDDLEIKVTPPVGAPVFCSSGSERRAVTSEFFETLRPGAHRSLAVQLRERCPTGTFDRPGAYLLEPQLVLAQRGREFGLSGFTGEIDSSTTTRLRVRTGRLPYHARAPHVDTSAPAPSDDDDED